MLRSAAYISMNYDGHASSLLRRESSVLLHCLESIPGLHRWNNQRRTFSDASDVELRFSRPFKTTSIVQRVAAESVHSAGPLRSTDLIMSSAISATSAYCISARSRIDAINWHAALHVLVDVISRATTRQIRSQLSLTLILRAAA